MWCLGLGLGLVTGNLKNLIWQEDSGKSDKKKSWRADLTERRNED